jgi:hypothetical protein
LVSRGVPTSVDNDEASEKWRKDSTWEGCVLRIPARRSQLGVGFPLIPLPLIVVGITSSTGTVETRTSSLLFVVTDMKMPVTLCQ